METLGELGRSHRRCRRDVDPAAFERPHADNGVVRYLLDRLTGQQVAAITAALLKAPGVEAQIKIAIPRGLAARFGLPKSVITDDRTVALRYAECDKPALLMANTDDDQGSCPQDVTLIGAKQLTEDVAPWVEAAGAGSVCRRGSWRLGERPWRG